MAEKEIAEQAADAQAQAQSAALPAIDPDLTTVGQPTEGGCAYICFDEPKSIPTDATTPMSTFTDFESLGDIGPDGFTIGKSISADKKKNWNGDVVLTVVNSVEENVKVSFIEPNRPTVAKLKNGTDAVEAGTDGSVSHIKGGGYLGKPCYLVFDELECNGFLRRTVLHRATPESYDDEPHQKGELIAYGMTLSLSKKNGATFDIYRAKAAE